MTDKAKPSDTRKTLWVDPELQKRIVGIFVLIGLSMVFVNMLIFYIFMRQMVQYLGDTSASPELYSFVQSLWMSMASITLVVSLILLIGFAVYGLIFSNQIAGPIYRVNTAIDELIGGKSNVNFNVRKNDYFQNLSKQVQKLIQKYESQK